MDPQTLFNAVISVASVLGGIMLKSIYDAIQELRTQDGDLHERINTIPNTYMRRDDFTTFARDIKDSLNRIEDKLDNKVDK
jgi:uncharacterized membrane-anchored protein YjiN (DUF445 family)